MELKAPAYLMLGLVRLGARSGYAIKQAADASTRFFWPTSLGQVYPTLGRLEAEGLLERSEDSHGARARFSYGLSPEGEAALLDWLRAPEEAPVQFRDEGLLRLFFADALAPADQLALVRRLRERNEAAAREIAEQVAPYTEQMERSGFRFPLLSARLGAESYGRAAEWLAELEAELEKSQ
ncbi:MAG TPA: helix-turn-helix transcriptional regulator [Solirubrobacterales bacterium]|nr:helix-turn-helix transcriptional regulator [Solirubrobacterales bacterium]